MKRHHPIPSYLFPQHLTTRNSVPMTWNSWLFWTSNTHSLVSLVHSFLSHWSDCDCLTQISKSTFCWLGSNVVTYIWCLDTVKPGCMHRNITWTWPRMSREARMLTLDLQSPRPVLWVVFVSLKESQERVEELICHILMIWIEMGSNARKWDDSVTGTCPCEEVMFLK